MERLSLRQIMWLGLLLIGVMVLAFTWQSVAEYSEWGVAWLLSIPGLVEEKLVQFVEDIAEPAITWLQGIPGLIALGAVSGLVVIRSLGPKRAWEDCLADQNFMDSPRVGLGPTVISPENMVGTRLDRINGARLYVAERYRVC